MATTAKEPDLRDQRIEDWLDQLGVEYVYDPDFPLANINREESYRNQARIIAHDVPVFDEYVNLFQQSMENGDAFPPILVYRKFKSKRWKAYVTIDGNHRELAAERAGKETFPTYEIVNAADGVIESLTYAANTKHGVPTSPKERAIQGAFLVEGRGMTIASAAELLGIPRHAIDEERRRQKTLARLEGKLRKDQIAKLSASHIQRLNSIQSDNVLIEAGRLAADTGMKSEEVGLLVKEIKARRTEATQLEVVAAESTARASLVKQTLGGKIPLPAKVMRVSSVIGQVIALPDTSGLTVDDPDYAANLGQRARLAAQRCEEIASQFGAS
jgi:hypothetical protein